MQQFATDPRPEPSTATRIRGWRARGVEAPLRAVMQPGERLLVCAAVRFPGRPADQRLWLTDSRFLFTRTEGPFNRVVISVPLRKSTLTIESTTAFCLHLGWMDESGQPRAVSFRSESWKDSLRQGAAGGVAGGAAQGAVGAIIGVAVGAAITHAAGAGNIPAQDQRLYRALVDACKAPTTARPNDLTNAAGKPLAGRLLLVVPLSLFAVALLAAAVYAFSSFQTKQAYEAAPVCGPATIPDCRLEQTAIVTSYRSANGKYAFCDLSMSRPDGSTVTADLHTVDICASRPEGETIVLEYWRGSTTAVIPPGGRAQETSDNPEYNWRFGYVITGLLILLWLIFGIAAVVTLPAGFARRALLRASARSVGYPD
ncbi:MAG TPA: hypothetical protein VII89_01700 [Candidatus Dormibacteraeota bacterium]